MCCQFHTRAQTNSGSADFVTYHFPASFKLGSTERLSADSLPFIVGLGTMFLAAHVSGIGAVFPSIIGQLGVSVAKGQWILTAYTLSLSACLLVFGSVADRIGLRRVYITGLAVFGVSSGACALAGEVWALILLRAVQGVGAAMVSATSVALIGGCVAQRRLGRAVGWQTGMTYAGLALGPIFAGYAAQQFGWRILFAINVPAAALAILVAWRGPEQDSEIIGTTNRAFSFSGMMWIVGMTGLLIFLSGNKGHMIGGSCAALCMGSFLWVDRRSSEPLFGSWMIRSRNFSAAAAGEAIYYLCLYAIGFLVPLYLARGRGFTSAHIGVFLGVQSAARAVVAPFSGRLSDRFGARLFMWLGVFFLAVAVCCLYVFGGSTSAIWGALVGVGAGAGLFAPANSKILLCAAPAEKYGISAGLLATARNVGMTLGVGTAALLYAAFGGDNSNLDALHAARESFAVIAGIAIVFAALSIAFQQRGFFKPEQLEIT
jgi:MFS family permease